MIKKKKNVNMKNVNFLDTMSELVCICRSYIAIEED